MEERQVALAQMLDARERRTLRQQQLLAQYHQPLLCFTMNIAGPVKNNDLIQRGFALGKRMLNGQLVCAKAECLHFEEISEATGNEAFFSVAMDATALKRLAVDIEESYPVGRLFDIDVLDTDGCKLERTEPRRCLICSAPAQECARSRRHTVAELWNKTQSLLSEALKEEDAQDAAQLACRSLLYEVCTTPKPGLVDCVNSGSHKDMDIFTFMSSAAALWPYFARCVLLGRETSTLCAQETFARLRLPGKQAEAAMLEATRGVNTHKGAIFSMGILCAALGRLSREQWGLPEAVLTECAAMTRGLVALDYSGLTEATAKTTGQKLYLKYGITGVRGQAEAGFPTVLNAGLPTLERCVSEGSTLNDAGCAALLALIAADTDTNLIARSDRTTQQRISSEAAQILRAFPCPDIATLNTLDTIYTQMNLSPGGSADLLAISYLLYFLRHEGRTSLESTV